MPHKNKYRHTHTHKISEFFIDNDTDSKNGFGLLAAVIIGIRYTYVPGCTVILFKLQHEPLIKLNANSFNLVNEKKNIHTCLCVFCTGLYIFQRHHFRFLYQTKYVYFLPKKNSTSNFDFLVFYFKQFFVVDVLFFF